VAAIIRS